MINRCVSVLVLAVACGVRGEEPSAPPSADMALRDTLKEIHNRGAEMYNRGDAVGCLRLFEGALELARTALSHRPQEQKLIREGLDGAYQIPSAEARAFALHDLIEEVRKRLTGSIKEGPKRAVAVPQETIPVLPRKSLANLPKETPNITLVGGETAAPKAAVPTPVKEVVDPKTSLTGRFFWDGEGLEGVKLMFVLRAGKQLKIFETVTAAGGQYVVRDLVAGQYTVVLNPLPGESKHALPNRYRSADTSPLVYVLSPGEKHDFLLK